MYVSANVSTHVAVSFHVDRINGEFWKRKIIERAVYIMEEEVSEANAERMARNEKFQEVDTEREYRYGDFFDVEQSLGSEEEKPYVEWEEEIKPRRL